LQDEAPAVESLIRRARSGDPAALETLIGHCREFVRCLVRARCGGQLRARVDSSDLVQETLLRAAQNIGQFQGEGEAAWCAWLTRIAEHEVVRQLRVHVGAEKRTVEREQPLEPPGPAADASSRLGQWFARSLSTPSQAAMRNERVLVLAEALGRLPEDYREVLVLRHLEGLDFPEIAGRLGRSHGAVRVLWTRALKKLRDELAGDPRSDGNSCHV
jgi:RNA polymerase sigma-70 factor, ECF subfamily